MSPVGANTVLKIDLTLRIVGGNRTPIHVHLTAGSLALATPADNAEGDRPSEATSDATVAALDSDIIIGVRASAAGRRRSVHFKGRGARRRAVATGAGVDSGDGGRDTALPVPESPRADEASAGDPAEQPAAGASA